jgi:hypothetical protein
MRDHADGDLLTAPRGGGEAKVADVFPAQRPKHADNRRRVFCGLPQL